MTCKDSGSRGTESYVKGICRDASIWEHNDTKHTPNAIKWYEKGSLERTGTDIRSSDSYKLSGPEGKITCSAISNGKAYPTYAISRNIYFIGSEETYIDNVNVYDGLAYNKYTANTTDYETFKKAKDGTEFNASSYKLVEMDYFIDTMKDKTGTARNQFMSLAPNSITKLRLYIWLEGQDIDNYDFTQLGKQVKINFGFTKERFTESDVSHNGSSIDLRSVPYTKAKGVVKLDQKAIEDGVTYDATLKIFTAPKTVDSFTFTDDGAGKTATYTSISNTWEVTGKN